MGRPAKEHETPDAVWDEIYADSEAEERLPHRPGQRAPSRATRLLSTAFMAFIKGAIGSAIVVAPFFGLWAALATALAFTGFCLVLAVRRLPREKVENEIRIEQADTCYPKVRR